MISRNLTELTVLGIAKHGPMAPGSFATVARVLAPDVWQPSNEVITAGLRRGLDTGHLRHQTSGDKADALMLTESGTYRLDTLLRQDPPQGSTAMAHVFETLQICFLDAADATIASFTLDRMKARLENRLALFEKGCARCPNHSYFGNLWMTMEQWRLENMAHMLETISAHLPGARPFRDGNRRAAE